MRTFIARLKDIFIPSERNGMVPYALHEKTFALYFVLALVLLLSPSYFAADQLASLTEPHAFNAESVIRFVNASRRAADLPPLAENQVLGKTAEKKIADMFTRQYFAHVSPQGKTPWMFLKEEGYSYRAAGENLAADFLSAEDAHAALMQSPTHRANILNSLYSEIGVSVRQGTLDGRPSVLVAQYFGKPKVAAATAVAARTPAPAPRPARVPARVSPAARRAAVTAAPTATAPTISAAVATPLPAGAVLGTETPPAQDAQAAPFRFFARLARGFEYARTHIPVYIGLKLVAFLAIFSLLLAVAFLLTRTGAVHFGTGIRTAALILIFFYAALSGIHPWAGAHLTPIATSELIL